MSLEPRTPDQGTSGIPQDRPWFAPRWDLHPNLSARHPNLWAQRPNLWAHSAPNLAWLPTVDICEVRHPDDTTGGVGLQEQPVGLSVWTTNLSMCERVMFKDRQHPLGAVSRNSRI